MGKMSRDKGKRGELEVVELLRRHGFEARRGQQHRGGPDSPDVIHDIPGMAIEVKRRETLSLYPTLEKASDDAADDGDKQPVVFHRRSGKPWIVVLYADNFLNIMQKIS